MGQRRHNVEELHYGTLEDLERLTADELIVPLIGTKVGAMIFPAEILDEHLVETRQGNGYHICDCGSCCHPDSTDPALVHDLLDKLAEIEDDVRKDPHLASDPEFLQRFEALYSYAAARELLSALEPDLAVHLNQLAFDAFGTAEFD